MLYFALMFGTAVASTLGGGEQRGHRHVHGDRVVLRGPVPAHPGRQRAGGGPSHQGLPPAAQTLSRQGHQRRQSRW